MTVRTRNSMLVALVVTIIAAIGCVFVAGASAQEVELTAIDVTKCDKHMAYTTPVSVGRAACLIGEGAASLDAYPFEAGDVVYLIADPNMPGMMSTWKNTNGGADFSQQDRQAFGSTISHKWGAEPCQVDKHPAWVTEADVPMHITYGDLMAGGLLDMIPVYHNGVEVFRYVAAGVGFCDFSVVTTTTTVIITTTTTEQTTTTQPPSTTTTAPTTTTTPSTSTSVYAPPARTNSGEVSVVMVRHDAMIPLEVIVFGVILMVALSLALHISARNPQGSQV